MRPGNHKLSLRSYDQFYRHDMGIEVLDHIIIGDGVFVSLKEKGMY